MSSNKLRDAQLVLLSSAAQHPDGAIELELKGAAAKKVVGKLLREGLIEEVPSRATLPVWRRDDNQGSLALCITKNGLAAIGVEPSVSEAKPDAPTETQNANGTASKQPRRVKRLSKPASRVSKQDRVIEMLQRSQGATISTIMKATGWQPHSVRGFLTAVVRNKLGLTLESDKSGEERVYRIAAARPKSKAKSGSQGCVTPACPSDHPIARRLRPRSTACGPSACKHTKRYTQSMKNWQCVTCRARESFTSDWHSRASHTMFCSCVTCRRAT